MKKDIAKITKLLNSFINNFTIHDYDEMAASEYAIIRSELEKRGKVIGSNDLFIAAHAKSLGAILITNNLKEFERVNELELENWIE